MTKRSKKSKLENSTKPEPVPESEGTAAKSRKKTVFLKQFLVSGSENPKDPKSETKAFFVLATCALNARQEFEQRFGLKVIQCCQTAESELTKDDVLSHDFWKEGRNRELKLLKAGLSPSAKRYFETKALAEKVQVAKLKVGIRDWDSATRKQLSRLNDILNEQKQA